MQFIYQVTKFISPSSSCGSWFSNIRYLSGYYVLSKGVKAGERSPLCYIPQDPSPNGAETASVYEEEEEEERGGGVHTIISASLVTTTSWQLARCKKHCIIVYGYYLLQLPGWLLFL